MTGFNHGLTGALIAITVKKPELAIPLAFVSHFVTDAIPHWDYGTHRKDGEIGSRRFNRFLISDFSLAIILMIILAVIFPAHKWTIWACMIAAASPDAAWGYYYYVKRSKKLDWLSWFHNWIEWSETPKGAVVEAAWFVIIGSVILSLR